MWMGHIHKSRSTRIRLPFPSPSFPPSLLPCRSPLPPHFSSLSICIFLFPRTCLYKIHLHSFTRTEIANIAELSMTRMTAYLPIANPCNWPREAPLHPNHCRTPHSWALVINCALHGIHLLDLNPQLYLHNTKWKWDH